MGCEISLGGGKWGRSRQSRLRPHFPCITDDGQPQWQTSARLEPRGLAFEYSAEDPIQPAEATGQRTDIGSFAKADALQDTAQCRNRQQQAIGVTLPLHFEAAAHQFVNEFSARKPMEAIHVFIM